MPGINSCDVYENIVEGRNFVGFCLVLSSLLSYFKTVFVVVSYSLLLLVHIHLLYHLTDLLIAMIHYAKHLQKRRKLRKQCYTVIPLW